MTRKSFYPLLLVLFGLGSSLPLGPAAFADGIQLAQKANGKKKKKAEKNQAADSETDAAEDETGETGEADKKPGVGAGLLFHLGLASIKWKDTGAMSVEQGGLGIGFGGVYSMAIAERCTLGLGGGY